MLFNTDSVYTLLDENGHDLATQYMANYAADRTKVVNWYGDDLLRQGRDYIAATAGHTHREFQTAKEYAEYALEEHVSDGFMFLCSPVGEPHGEHSGDQDCLMRYYFAEFYPVQGKDDAYYLVTPGTERIGMEICHSRAGTGINAPKPPNLPQSRYGDAAGDAGKCFEQICPNDAIAPRTTK